MRWRGKVHWMRSPAAYGSTEDRESVLALIGWVKSSNPEIVLRSGKCGFRVMDFWVHTEARQ
jgi:hypothetical protein